MAAAEEEDIRFFQELMRLWACTFGNSHCIGNGRFAKNRHPPGRGRTVASPGSATIGEVAEGGVRGIAPASPHAIFREKRFRR
ncbi:hypothetical protein Metli_1470 [Methanofollis liminatans DSM 4140]|uniref:Uncharacterized protein n=1 Tax=Methanofollis liminatans DSM 4140 TaxID=28892 RepID=J0S0P8_9EURY|nr:hypothetical protein Metli_1470 [Methanofollis liminatans DSM 4140]